ncbi:acetate--CoA ligase family protein [Maledivibacter halophilus]|uniref:Acetyl-CoA synthetase (ADP-forming) beta subunit n=1 Tax=Maledivibacter halophilus TaxID=36842 RepID=A0A1T5IAJ9_9FIRM|nr:acetate--CoA ligase family protein [Maledivibacter halophilus]SKC36053.1 acetyl-CoA synthetase (ADP-forming) beta subunit [Maledivibacter halophilus]
MSRFLNELDGKNLLSQYDIPMAKGFLSKTVDEAKEIAKKLKFPVVMKILSSDILHKTEAGCVFTNVKTEDELVEIFDKILYNAKFYKTDAKIDGILIQEMVPVGLEVIIGMKKDPQFGPVIMVGSGGVYVEVFKDISLRLLPITKLDANKMLAETKLFEIIKGVRGTVYDKEALINILLKVSKLIIENSTIEEIDINPIFLYEEGKGAKGVDALIKL